MPNLRPTSSRLYLRSDPRVGLHVVNPARRGLPVGGGPTLDVDPTGDFYSGNPGLIMPPIFDPTTLPEDCECTDNMTLSLTFTGLAGACFCALFNRQWDLVNEATPPSGDSGLSGFDSGAGCWWYEELAIDCDEGTEHFDAIRVTTQLHGGDPIKIYCRKHRDTLSGNPSAIWTTQARYTLALANLDCDGSMSFARDVVASGCSADNFPASLNVTSSTP